MATHIKDLVEDNGDITRPVTEAGAVLLSGGGDLETELTKYVTAEDIATTSALTPPVQTNMIADDAVTAAKIAGGETATTLANGALVEVVGTTTGNFNYALKYADGRLVCFQRYTITNASTTAWGNCYRATFNPSSNYAVSFTANPTIVYTFVSQSVNANTGWAVNTGGPSATGPQQAYIVRPNSGNVSGTLDIVAYGFWK